MALRARKVSGAFEKWAPGLEPGPLYHELNPLLTRFHTTFKTSVILGFSCLSSWSVTLISQQSKYNQDIKLAHVNFVFNGRQVVKDTKVKARYHHLIANSFVEVSDTMKILLSIHY